MQVLLLWIFSAIFGLWLLLTVIRTLSPAFLIKAKFPRFLWPLLPNWNLFAPKPGVADYYVMYRDQQGSEAAGPWQLAFEPETRKWSHGLWNPDKTQAKAVFDQVQQLAGVISQMKPGGEQEVMQSAPYRYLLHFVRNFQGAERGAQTQFAIVVREPARQYEATLIVSPYYPL